MADPFQQKLDHGLRLLNQHRYSEAASIFDSVCDALPMHTGALIGSAVASASMFDPDAVEQRFNQLEKIPAISHEMWVNMAMISRGLHRPEWETRFFNNAIANPAAPAEAFGLFALFLERNNQLDRATEVFERGLQIDRANPSCLLAKAQTLRRKKMVDSADNVLHTLVKIRPVPTQTLIAAYYELARLDDQRGNFAGAMSALANAKLLAKTTPEFPLFQKRAVAVERNKYQFLTSIDADYFANAANWRPEHPRPMALLGGHPRSGTTLLEQVLDAHTGIVSADEIAAFDAQVCTPFLHGFDTAHAAAAALQMPTTRLEQFRRGYFQTMESMIGQPISNRLLIDKNPSYTDWIPVYARVFPECKFIIAIRDPRDVVLSCYFQNLPINTSTIRFSSIKDTAMRYCNTMVMWAKCRQNMNPQQWIEVRYELLVNDIEGQTALVMQKLDLVGQPAQLRPDTHAREKTIFSPTYADVVNPVSTSAIGKWKKYEPWLIEAMPILEPMLDMFNYR